MTRPEFVDDANMRPRPLVRVTCRPPGSREGSGPAMARSHLGGIMRRARQDEDLAVDKVRGVIAQAVLGHGGVLGFGDHFHPVP